MSLIHWAWNRSPDREARLYGISACSGLTMSRVTIHSDQVTCPTCLEVIAKRVEEVLDMCELHGVTKAREACDVCMGRGDWGGLADMIHSVDAEADDYVTMCGLDLDVGHLSRSVLEHMVTCPTCKAVRAVEWALVPHDQLVGDPTLST